MRKAIPAFITKILSRSERRFLNLQDSPSMGIPKIKHTRSHYLHLTLPKGVRLNTTLALYVTSHSNHQRLSANRAQKENRSRTREK